MDAQGCSQAQSDLSSDLRRFLQLGEEEDDATSKLSELPTMNPKSEPADVTVIQNNVQCHHDGETTVAYQEVIFFFYLSISLLINCLCTFGMSLLPMFIPVFCFSWVSQGMLSLFICN